MTSAEIRAARPDWPHPGPHPGKAMVHLFQGVGEKCPFTSYPSLASSQYSIINCRLCEPLYSFTSSR